MMPEEFFQTLELEPNGVWVPAREIDGITYGSGVRIGDDGGPCVAKRDKYHIFTKIKSEPHIYWVVHTETKEVRRTNGQYRLKGLKDKFFVF